jgi:hypothetical protein
MTRKRSAFAGTIQGPADLSQQKPWKSGDEVPPTVCIRHGKFLPCKPFANDPDCLHSSHPSMVSLVRAYQRDTDGIAYDFEHVVRNWIFLMKGQGSAD